MKTKYDYLFMFHLRYYQTLLFLLLCEYKVCFKQPHLQILPIAQCNSSRFHCISLCIFFSALRITIDLLTILKIVLNLFTYFTLCLFSNHSLLENISEKRGLMKSSLVDEYCLYLRSCFENMIFWLESIYEFYLIK